MSADDDYKTPFKVFVGIDFGTDGSGLAYSFQNEDGSYSSYIHNMWNSSGATKKPKTSVLCDDNSKKISVGTRAKKMFFSNQGDQEWKLFEKFKMSLYDEPVTKPALKKADEKFDFVDDLKDEMKSSNDKELIGTSETIFIIYLNFLKDNAFKFIEKNLRKRLKLQGDKKRGFPEVQYYLTVPAIWSDKAKDRMIQWAIMSGLVEGKQNKHTKEVELKIANQMQIVYEPDCASLSLQHAIIRNLNEGKVKQKSRGLKALQPEVSIKVPFKKGDKYILLDVGGGTCDVACHEIMGKFSIAEVLHPSGGKWGSCEIDNKFIELLSKLFSEILLDIYQMDDQQQSYLKFLNNFSIEKERYYKKHDEDLPEYHNINMPTNFVQFLIGQFNDEFANNDDRFNYEQALEDLNIRIQNKATVYVPKSNRSRLRDGNLTQGIRANYMVKIVPVDDNVVQSDVEGDTDDEFDKEEINYVLSMSNDVWQYLFDHITTPINNHCQRILENPLMKDCKYIFLVGGFANSKYFQERMKESFGGCEDFSIVVPDLPGLCVVDGASRYGFNNKFVKIRRLPKTYGIAVGMKKSEFSKVDLERFPDGFVKKNTYFSDFNQDYYIRDCFHIFVKKDETIKLNEKPITYTPTKNYKTQTKATVQIYCSDKEKPLTVNATEATILGEIPIDLDNADSVTVEFYFSSTLLTVYCYPEGKPQKKKRCRVKYL